MSKYQEIRDAFKAHQDAIHTYRAENESLINVILAKLPAYFQVDEHYTAVDGTQKQYFIADHSDGATRGGATRGCITYFDDGTFDFVIGITAESAENTFPKTIYTLLVICQRSGEKLTVRFGEEEWQGKFSDFISNPTPLFDIFYTSLLNYLNVRPESGIEKTQIGFALTK